jgi:hypothetical protein
MNILENGSYKYLNKHIAISAIHKDETLGVNQ